MGFMFCDLHVSLNNSLLGDINLSNLPCSKCMHGLQACLCKYVTVADYAFVLRVL